MIFGWSPHQKGGGWWEPSRYLLMAQIEKKVGPRREKIMRTPTPELLLGAPHLFQSSIGLFHFQNRYRVLTMTFAKSDIDTPAFNRGDRAARQAVAACIEAFFKVAFAGVPETNRFPSIVGTHTHTGRLEVNIAMAHGIRNAKGQVCSFNPDPPKQGSKRDFLNLNDSLNKHFGWKDPGCPSVRQKLKTADWIQKQAAESERNFVSPQAEDPFVNLWLVLKSLLDDFENRADLLEGIAPILTMSNLYISDQTNGSITIKNLSSESSEGMVLRGTLMNAATQASPTDFEKRKEYLVGSDDRLTKSWQKRAAWNSNRFSGGNWAETVPDFYAILNQPTLLLPECHPGNAPKPKPRLKQEPEPHMRSHTKDILTAHLAKLRENLISAFMYTGLFPQIMNSLAGVTTNLKTKMEQMNAKYPDPSRPADQPFSVEQGIDHRVDQPSQESDRKQRHRKDRRADAGIDSGIEQCHSLDGQAERDTGKVQRAGTGTANSDRRDQKPEEADLSNRNESLKYVFGNLRTRPAGRLNVWKAIKRAVRSCCQSSAVTTHLISSDDPKAIAICGTDWRIRVSSGNIIITHGDLPAADFQRIAKAIQVELKKTDHLPTDWRPVWKNVGNHNDGPENDLEV